MKIQGPASGPGVEAPQGLDGADAAPETQAPDGTGFAEKLDQGTAIGKASSARPQAAEATGPVADIGADLKAGKVTAQAAIEQVIARVLDKQIGTDAPAAVREQVGAALRDALESDPLLLDKVRALGG